MSDQTLIPKWFLGAVDVCHGVTFFKATGKNQSPQRAAIEYGQQHTFFAAQQVAAKNYAFASWPDADAFLEWYATYPGPNHFYEVVMEDTPACLCLDVEKYQVTRDDADAEALLHQVLGVVLDALDSINIHPGRDSFIVSNGARDTATGHKVSYHIYNPSVVFENFEVVQAAFFRTYVLPLVGDYISKFHQSNNANPKAAIVDGSIYTTRRMMRLVGSRKFGTQQPLVLRQGGNIRDSLVSAPLRPANVSFAQLGLESAALPAKRAKRAVSTLTAVPAQLLPTHYPTVLKMLRKFDTRSSLLEKEPGKIYHVLTNGQRVCPAGEVHDHQNANVRIDSSGNVWYNCFPSAHTKKCHGRGMCIGNLASSQTEEVQLDTSGLAEVVTYNEPRVRPLRFKTKVLAVRAHCGAGKSHQANELIKRVRKMQTVLGAADEETLMELMQAVAKDNKRVCVVSPRISFSNAIKGAFKLHEFVLYNECEDFQDYPRIIVQYESLHRLVGSCVEFDLVILDELETILECALSTVTNKHNLLTNSRVFEMIIAQARKVLALDADLSNKSLNMLKTLAGPENITLHVNTCQPLPRTVRVYENNLVWVKRLQQKLAAGKRIAIPVTSKRWADQHILPLLETLKYAYYHADNRDKRQDLVNIAEEWCKYQVVMFTPCINVGCDFSVEGHFDEIWAMASSQSAVPRELFQMLARCRHPKSPIMHVLVNVNGKGGCLGPLSADKVIEDMQHKAGHRVAIEEELRANWLLSSQHQRLEWVGGDDWLTQVYAHSMVEKNKALADYVGEVKRLAAEKQYRLVVDAVTLSGQESRLLSGKAKQEEGEHQEEQIAAFDAAELLDEEQARHIEGTQQDARSALLLRKHKYCARFRVAVDGRHWWDCHQRLGVLYNVRRLQTRDASAQLTLEAGVVRHVALHDTHYEGMLMLQQLAQWLGLERGALDTDAVLTKAAWQNAADRILTAKDRLSSVFGVKFRLTEDTEAWKQAKTMVNQVYSSYVSGSFRVTQQLRKGDARGERVFKLVFDRVTGDQSVLDVAETLV